MKTNPSQQRPRYRLRFVGGPLQGRTQFTPFLPNQTRANTEPATNYYLVRLRGSRAVMVEEKLCRELKAWQEINRQLAIRMIADHREYIVCTICDAISSRVITGSICARCHGYRFTTDLEEICTAADRISYLTPAWLCHSFSI